MTLENLKLEKNKLLQAKKNVEKRITEEFNKNHTSQSYYFLINTKVKIDIDLKKINSEIVKLIIVRDSFTFGSPF